MYSASGLGEQVIRTLVAQRGRAIVNISRAKIDAYLLVLLLYFFSLDHRYQCRSRPKSRERTWSRQCLLSRLSGCDAQGKYMIQGSSIRNSQVCLSFLC